MKVRETIGSDPGECKKSSDGLEYEADPKHVCIICEELGLQGWSKGFSSPYFKREVPEEDNVQMEAAKATPYRARAARRTCRLSGWIFSSL